MVGRRSGITKAKELTSATEGSPRTTHFELLAAFWSRATDATHLGSARSTIIYAAAFLESSPTLSPNESRG